MRDAVAEEKLLTMRKLKDYTTSKKSGALSSNALIRYEGRDPLKLEDPTL